MESVCSLKTYEDEGLLLKSCNKIWEEGSFTGKELDDSGLYYFGARYYDPVLGSWLSPDPATEGLNWYSYCGNNPLKYVDLWGLMTDAEAQGFAQTHPGWCPLSNNEQVNYTPGNKGNGYISSGGVVTPKGNGVIGNPEGEKGGKETPTPETTGVQEAPNAIKGASEGVIGDPLSVAATDPSGTNGGGGVWAAGNSELCGREEAY